MSYRCVKIEVSPGGQAVAGFPVGERINNWLASNQFVTVVGMTISWKVSRRRGSAPNLHMFFREGGTRQYAMDFKGRPGISVQQQVSQFFAANPDMVSRVVVDLRPPHEKGTEHLVIVYSQRRDDIYMARPGIYPGYAPTDGPVLPGTWGLFQNLLDPAAPPIYAVNAGNGTWLEGVAGFLIRNIDAVPDADLEARAIGGLGHECGIDAPFVGVPPDFFEDCSCIEAPFAFPGAVAPVPTLPVPTTTVVVTPPYG